MNDCKAILDKDASTGGVNDFTNKIIGIFSFAVIKTEVFKK